MKRPAFQFYPGDWQRDAALRACSVGARGLWIEMICIMHQAEPYGHLVVNGLPISPETLGRMVGCSKAESARWLAELEAAGVYNRDGDVIVSRRMVRDEQLRKVRAEGGKLGGNPALKDNHKVGDKVNHNANLQPTPSSSSSSSSSSSINPKAERASRLPADWVLPEEWANWATQERAISVSDVNIIACQFRDYWIAKPGKDGRKLDWFATWRNWVRNERSGSKPAQRITVDA